MTPLTKIFIVFHVVLSLLLAAGLVVFVNRTEDFKTAMVNQAATIGTLRSKVDSSDKEAGRQSADAAAARRERDTAITEGQAKAAGLQTQLNGLQGQLADAKSNATIIQVALDNATAALTASETSRKAQSDILDTTRADNNTLAKKNSDLNLTVADLTNRLEVATRQVTFLNESLAEFKTRAERAEKLVVDMGGTLNREGGLGMGAPSINGVIINTAPQGGIPYATISVGSQDQVKRGMKFSVVDRDKGNFLGELTIEQVDEKQATGRLEGPRLSDIVNGKTEVKTQL